MTLGYLDYYRVMKGLRPPRVCSDDDGALCNLFLQTDARGLAQHAQDPVDRFATEMWPDLADELLEDWERVLRIVPPAGATDQARRDALLAKWTGGVSCSGPDLRKALVALLHSETAFRDNFDLASISWRWTQGLGNGTCAAAGSVLTLAAAAAAHCDWTGSAREATLIRKLLHAFDDSVTLDAVVSAFGGGVDTAGGLVLWESDTDAWLFGLVEDGGLYYLQADRIEDGVLYRNVSRGLDVTPPYALRMVADGTTVSFYGSTATLPPSGEYAVDPWSLMASVAQGTIKPRWAGLYCRNTASSYNAASIGFGWARFSHGREENNVELIETVPAIVPAGTPHIFTAFVHRDPTDSGSYNIKEAQGACDRLKEAHVYITVGESDCFLCDDSYSLTDRDVLGV